MSKFSLQFLRDKRDVYSRLLGFLLNYKKIFILSVISMIIYGITDGVIPLLIRSILDDVFGNKNVSMIYLLPVIVIIFTVIRSVVGFFQHYYMALIGFSIVRDMRNDLSNKLLLMSPGFFHQYPSGNLISLMTNDVMLAQSAITNGVAHLIRDVIRIICLFFVSIYMDPLLGLICFVGLPLGIWPVIQFGKRIRRQRKIGQLELGGLTVIFQESLQGIKMIQAFCAEKYQKSRFIQENERLTSVLKKAEKYSALSGPVNELIASIAIAAVLFYGGFSVLSGTRTQGDFIAFLIAMFLMYEPIKELGRLNSMIQTSAGAAERIFEILDVESDIVEPSNPTIMKESLPGFVLKNVTFSYPGSKSGAALKNMSIEVPSGSTVAFVGMSGGGKSTVPQLLLRYYDADSGSVEVGGVNVKELSLSDLRSSISYVSQHPVLFRGTVIDNIRYGNLNASREEIIQAAKFAHAHEFITKLDKGYDADLVEQGQSLSGGERARLALARALLKDAPILILDEATAALDSKSEELIQNALQILTVGKTVLIIAHRLSTVKEVDEIFLIADGKVVEKGSHHELLTSRGEYSKLYDLQFSQKQV